MADTYCGKNCTDCTYKDELACPGCAEGPGSAWSHACELAECCRDKGHQNCETCSYKPTCGRLRRRENMAPERLKRCMEEKERQTRLAQKSTFLGKWLWLLFLLFIPSAIAGLFTSDIVQEWVPGLYLFGQILNIACGIAYGCILLKLTPASDSYRAAGICCLIMAGFNLVSAVILNRVEMQNWSIVITLPGAVIRLVQIYQEYMGHAEVLWGVDSKLADQWKLLWKWNIGILLAFVGSFVLAMIIPVLGLLLILASVIGLAVVGILQLIYLYRTANVFRKYMHAAV